MQSISTKLFDHTPGKRCLICKQLLPLSDFYDYRCNRNGKIYRQSNCKTCVIKYLRDWHKTPEGQRSRRRRELRKKYSMEQHQYDAMLADQGAVCAICGKAETRLNRRGVIRPLSVDHCHSTGTVRGLLCSSCNNGIGYFGDKLQLLKAAVAYLENR